MYNIGDIQFKTKKEAHTYTKDLLINNANRNITEGDTVYDYLMDMVYLHSDDKIEDGIESFDIKYNKYNHICMFVNQHTKKDVDFSWCYICTFKTTTPYHLLTRALRHSIDYQIKEFKNNKIKINKILKCELCESSNKIHIDHLIQFKQLKTDFLALTTKKIPLTFDDCLITYQPKFKAVDYDFMNEWIQYHQKHAILRPLCRDCNLSRPKYKIV